mmetsp:Transcript_50528/g.93992  ORF Transcript_50528/g.93992 Transcript_50528/m.93992 type:complete len:645 (+) Transcript_50528:49-1983(+)
MDAAALPVDQTRPTSTEHGNVPLPSPKSRPITYGEFLERRVRIRNLKLKSDLNGLFGSIKGFDPQTLRYMVEVDGELGRFAIKAVNLRSVLKDGDAVFEDRGGEWMPLSTLSHAAAEFMQPGHSAYYTKSPDGSTRWAGNAKQCFPGGVYRGQQRRDNAIQLQKKARGDMIDQARGIGADLECFQDQSLACSAAKQKYVNRQPQPRRIANQTSARIHTTSKTDMIAGLQVISGIDRPSSEDKELLARVVQAVDQGFDGIKLVDYDRKTLGTERDHLNSVDRASEGSIIMFPTMDSCARAMEESGRDVFLSGKPLFFMFLNQATRSKSLDGSVVTGKAVMVLMMPVFDNGRALKKIPVKDGIVRVSSLGGNPEFFIESECEHEVQYNTGIDKTYTLFGRTRRLRTSTFKLVRPRGDHKNSIKVSTLPMTRTVVHAGPKPRGSYLKRSSDSSFCSRPPLTATSLGPVAAVAAEAATSPEASPVECGEVATAVWDVAPTTGTVPAAATVIAAASAAATNSSPGIAGENDEDIGRRRKDVASYILELVRQQKTFESAEAASQWEHELPQMAERFEELLFQQSKTMEEYADESTLPARLRFLADKYNTSEKPVGGSSVQFEAEALSTIQELPPTLKEEEQEEESPLLHL